MHSAYVVNVMFYTDPCLLLVHQSFEGLRFWEKAERREGACISGPPELETGGRRWWWEGKGSGGKGKGKDVAANCACAMRAASCLGLRWGWAYAPSPSLIRTGTRRGEKEEPQESSPFSWIAFFVLYRWFWNQIFI